MRILHQKKTKNVNWNNSSYLGISARKDLEEMFPSIEMHVLLYIRYQKVFPFWVQHNLLYEVLTERGFFLYFVFVRLYIVFHVLSPLRIYMCKMCVPDKDQDTVQSTDLWELWRERSMGRWPQRLYCLLNPLTLELDIYSLAHHLCKMCIFYEPRRVALGNTRNFVEE